MSGILRTARAVFSLLAPMTGTVATGALTVRATGADVVLPRNSYGIPLSAGERGTPSPHVLLKTTAETTVTAASASVPVRTVLGGNPTALELPADTRVLWNPRVAGVEPVSVVATPLSGATEATGFGAVKQIRFYEGVSPGTAAQDIWKAKVGAFPALVLIWDSSGASEPGRKGYRHMSERWLLTVVTSRLDSDDERRAEGLHIMEEATELLTERQNVDGELFSSPSAITITGRRRIVSTDSSYIYAIAFETERTLAKREGRTYPDWLTTQQDLDTASGETPEVSIVDQARFSMT